MVQRVERGTVSGLGTGEQTTTAVTREVRDLEPASNDGSALFEQLLALLPDPVASSDPGVDKLFKVDGIKTAAIPASEADDYYKASLLVTAVDSAGHVASRAITFKVWRQYQIAYDGSAVERRYDKP